ncbi:vegetative cell wall protein gp1-like [Myripristis murdjan]|uniref:vegetative cell wall protein gp1-like n=1 Tax=Myripristis murdjan TaxID=586833 RepID=UPI00117645F3|nr:vegetative cell wall protein gp1-like [Myripristis murdjan]
MNRPIQDPAEQYSFLEQTGRTESLAEPVAHALTGQGTFLDFHKQKLRELKDCNRTLVATITQISQQVAEITSSVRTMVASRAPAAPASALLGCIGNLQASRNPDTSPSFLAVPATSPISPAVPATSPSSLASPATSPSSLVSPATTLSSPVSPATSLSSLASPATNSSSLASPVPRSLSQFPVFDWLLLSQFPEPDRLPRHQSLFPYQFPVPDWLSRSLP